jgi:hypothetical protein
MEAWIIDDGPLDWLARQVEPVEVAKWPPDRFFVAEATALAARRDALESMAANRRLALLEQSGLSIRTFDVQVPSDAARILYEHLSHPSGTATNLAENQAIAWALTERQEAVLVTVDKRAAMLALAELGRGRVAHAFDLWIELRQNDLISNDQFQHLCNATRAADQSLNSLPVRCSM